jgi:hypothetical protein
VVQVYWNHVMELVTGWSAKEAFGRATFDVYGFYRNTYVRQSYFYYLKNAPLPQYVLCAAPLHR